MMKVPVAFIQKGLTTSAKFCNGVHHLETIWVTYWSGGKTQSTQVKEQARAIAGKSMK